ncbi:DNA starvation/stationary phase protection protein [Bacteroidia bacterium]|nr:DNA starvation/stationary phase protection protein [Bacteroidia bacterium]MDB9883186.1 DNA starvation/stationary phase protection protein [Bacteroidia bacterium]
MNSIGLPKQETVQITKKMNTLLASYSGLYMNNRGFDWNLKGKEFFELHLKFREVYDALILRIDEIAERILTLEGIPVHSFTENLKLSEIKEETNITNGTVALNSVLDGYKKVVGMQRIILEMATDIGDEGTASLMSDYITLQEKEIWMFRAYLA